MLRVLALGLSAYIAAGAHAGEWEGTWAHTPSDGNAGKCFIHSNVSVIINGAAKTYTITLPVTPNAPLVITPGVTAPPTPGPPTSSPIITPTAAIAPTAPTAAGPPTIIAPTNAPAPTAAPPTAIPPTAIAPTNVPPPTAIPPTPQFVTKVYDFTTITGGLIARCDQLTNVADPSDKLWVKYTLYDFVGGPDAPTVAPAPTVVGAPTIAAPSNAPAPTNAASPTVAGPPTVVPVAKWTVLALSLYQGTEVESCPPIQLPCGATSLDTTTGNSVDRFQLCKEGSVCPAYDPATGEKAAIGDMVIVFKFGDTYSGMVTNITMDPQNYTVMVEAGGLIYVTVDEIQQVGTGMIEPRARGWLTGSSVGNVDYSSTSRVTFGVIITLSLLVVVGLIVVFRAKIGELTAKITSGFEPQKMLYAVTGLSMLLFLMCAIATGLPAWAVGNEGSMGAFRVCPASINGVDCVDSLGTSNNNDAASDVLIAVRFFMMVGTLLELGLVAFSMLMVAGKVEMEKANIGFFVSLGAVVCNFFGMCCFAAFFYDVLVAEALVIRQEVALGPAFDLALTNWIFGFGQSFMFYSLVSGGTGGAKAAV